MTLPFPRLGEGRRGERCCLAPPLFDLDRDSEGNSLESPAGFA
jgi:hypothetical protein